MRLLLALALSLLVAMSAANAQPQPEPGIAPMPEWVEQIPVPAPDPALRDRPTQILLASTQSLYAADHIDHVVEVAMLAQNAQGIQALGTVTLPWRPGQSELIVHRVRIIRNGTVIDLLANGRRFTVLRRENNLESAMLDGTLTAVLQAEGLAIGDILEFSFTMRLHGGALPLRAENGFLSSHGQPMRHRYIRQIWPASLPIQWRATGLFDRARTRTSRLGTELVFDQMDVDGPEVPANAPLRFRLPAWLQLTQYRNWAEVSATLAPHFDQAAQLAPDAPLRQEIARIAAASPDPRVRTMAALQLVQEQVRYFALLMGDGNYLPATAEQSWSRRFADCKGKVVLLLAILRNLGIDAEPVLVNSTIGDSLADRLPMMSLFDHVIVRARIDGRSYWLDGTRSGDRNLDDLASSTLAWGLPLRASGATLEAMTYSPPAQPLMATNIVYDGSEGLQGIVPVRMEQILHGELATIWHVASSQTGRDEFIRQMRQDANPLPGTNSELVSVDFRDDPDHGAFTIIYAGRTQMNWLRAPGAAAQRFRFDNDTISWEVDLDRPAGPYHDVPYAFTIPTYTAYTETIILPHGGEGFTIEGQNLDHLVAGTRISRQLSIANGRAVAHSEFRRIEREAGAAAARDGLALIGTIKNDQAYLRAAIGALGVPHPVPSPTTRSGAGSNADHATATTSTTPAPPSPAAEAETLIQTGYDKLQTRRARAALEDFDRAVALSPQWSVAHAERGLALIQLNRMDEAERALTTAIQLDDTGADAHAGMGLLQLARGRSEDAIRAFSRTLELLPNDATTLGNRALAYEQLGRLDEALADLDAIVAAEPGHAITHASRAHIFARQGREAETIAAIDRAVAADPGNFTLVMLRGDFLDRFNRREEATPAFQSALAMFDRMTAAMAGADAEIPPNEPRLLLQVRLGRQAEAIAQIDTTLRRYSGNVMMLAWRCFVRVQANIELASAQRDCDQAIRAEPGHPIATPARALLGLRMQHWADAIRDFNRTLADEPNNATALFGRGIARLRSGDTAGGDGDIGTARRFYFDVDWIFTRLGLGIPQQPTTATAAAH